MPDSYKERALYGLRMLLLPFRVEPVMVEKSELAGPSIFYGENGSDLPEDTLHFGLATDTLEFFSQSVPFPRVERYLKVGEHRIPVLFNGSGDASFDPIASTFFFLSGWQEVNTASTDEHGRFPFEASLQSELGLADLPVVDWYRHIVSDLLRRKGLQVNRKEWAGKSWMFCPTHDIDYDKKWRPGIYKREVVDRVLLNAGRETAKDRILRITRAAHSLLHSEDPFRMAFIRMREEVKARKGKATYFMKSGGKGLRDVSYSLKDPFVFGQLTELNRDGFEIAHHPSYHAMRNPEKLRAEKQRLESVCGFPIRTHRAHYLRYVHPDSANDIQHAGYTLDSTLGFATRAGFRHGTCMPFPLFDPVRNEELSVWEMPLVIMESALFNRMNLSLEQAMEYTRNIMETCADFGGVCVALWHNTLWDEDDYPGWGEHFLSTISRANTMDASMDTLKNALDSWK